MGVADMEGAAMEAAGVGAEVAAADIMGVNMEVTMGAIRVMEGPGAFIMDISFPGSSVMATGPMPTKAAAFHAIHRG